MKARVPLVVQGRARLELLAALLIALAFGVQSLYAAQRSPDIQSQQGPSGAPSGNGLQPGPPEAAGHPLVVVPGAQPSQTLSVPQAWHPTIVQPLPPALPALPAPVIPAIYLGCWKGRPNGYDSFIWLTKNWGMYQVGTPGEMVVCFRNNTAEVTHAEVYVPPEKRILDVTLQLGLGYSTFEAHSIHTDIYSVTPARMHLRFQLTLAVKEHFFFILPVHMGDERLVEEVIATPIGTREALVESREVIYYEGEPAWSATWHAYFTPSDEPPQ